MDHAGKGTRVFGRNGSAPAAAGDRRNPARRCRGCALLVLLAAAGCGTPRHPGNPAPPASGRVSSVATASPPATPAPADTSRATLLTSGGDLTRETVGSFVIVQERLPRERWQMHMATQWLHLSFDMPDQRVNVSITDNGARLMARVRSSECSALVHPLQYPAGEDENVLFADLTSTLQRLVERCRSLDEGAGGYQGHLQRARADFPAAIRVMKARAVEMFGRRLERCTLQDFEAAFGSHHHPCRS